jgi:hypothetical protein
MLAWIRRRWDANKFLFMSRPCEKCGGTGASLVVDAIPAGKKVDGRTGLVTKTFTVRRADWVCQTCRREIASSESGGAASGVPLSSSGSA